MNIILNSCAASAAGVVTNVKARPIILEAFACTFPNHVDDLGAGFCLFEIPVSKNMDIDKIILANLYSRYTPPAGGEEIMYNLSHTICVTPAIPNPPAAVPEHLMNSMHNFVILSVVHSEKGDYVKVKVEKSFFETILSYNLGHAFDFFMISGLVTLTAKQ